MSTSQSLTPYATRVQAPAHTQARRRRDAEPCALVHEPPAPLLRLAGGAEPSSDMLSTQKGAKAGTTARPLGSCSAVRASPKTAAVQMLQMASVRVLDLAAQDRQAVRADLDASLRDVGIAFVHMSDAQLDAKDR